MFCTPVTPHPTIAFRLEITSFYNENMSVLGTWGNEGVGWVQRDFTGAVWGGYSWFDVVSNDIGSRQIINKN